MNPIIDNFNKQILIKVFIRLKKTTKNFSKLIVREPLDFIDFEVELNSYIDTIIFEVQNNKYKPQSPHVHLSAKNKGINRPTIVLTIEDALVYRFCIEEIEDILFAKARQKNIHGGIKITKNARPDQDGGYYEKWIKDWKEHRDNIKKGLLHKNYLVVTDIASYFEHINLLVLKDMVRSDVSKKESTLNLLFYLLEYIKVRYDYEVNTHTGLPQEDIDCSRILAYYFLHIHDNNMAAFAVGNNAEYYRFVDDMSILVDEEVIGKKSLKCLTESLRRLNLVSSIEKTVILPKDIAVQELFFNEDEKLDEIQEEAIRVLKENSSSHEVNNKIQLYFNELLKMGKDSYKNWIKILKRFITISTYTQSEMFLTSLVDLIKKHPIIFSDLKILKYLLRNQNVGDNYYRALNELLDYLYSEEKLYPDIETNLLEIFLSLPLSKVTDDKVKERLSVMGGHILFGKEGYNALSEYAKALACLFIFKFNNAEIEKVVKHYLKGNVNDAVLKKYLIFVSLTTKNEKDRRNVLEKSKKENSISIQRLVSFIENINKYKDQATVKKYIKNNELYILYDSKDKFKVKENIDNVRAGVLEELISIYS